MQPRRRAAAYERDLIAIKPPDQGFPNLHRKRHAIEMVHSALHHDELPGKHEPVAHYAGAISRS